MTTSRPPGTSWSQDPPGDLAHATVAVLQGGVLGSVGFGVAEGAQGDHGPAAHARPVVAGESEESGQGRRVADRAQGPGDGLPHDRLGFPGAVAGEDSGGAGAGPGAPGGARPPPARLGAPGPVGGSPRGGGGEPGRPQGEGGGLPAEAIRVVRELGGELGQEAAARPPVPARRLGGLPAHDRSRISQAGTEQRDQSPAPRVPGGEQDTPALRRRVARRGPGETGG